MLRALVSAESMPPPPPNLFFRLFFSQAPAMPPQNIHISAVSASQLEITWDPPPVDSQNGNIQGYKASQGGNAHQRLAWMHFGDSLSKTNLQIARVIAQGQFLLLLLFLRKAGIRRLGQAGEKRTRRLSLARSLVAIPDPKISSKNKCNQRLASKTLKRCSPDRSWILANIHCPVQLPPVPVSETGTTSWAETATGCNNLCTFSSVWHRFF